MTAKVTLEVQGVDIKGLLPSVDVALKHGTLYITFDTANRESSRPVTVF